MITWQRLPERIQEQLNLHGRKICAQVHEGTAQYQDSWLPLHPPVLTTAAYAEITDVSARVARLILECCLRRGRTAGELARVLGVSTADIVLLDEDTPISELLINAVRTDILIEGGVPRLVECNVDSALGGVYDSEGTVRRFLDAYRGDPVLARISAPASATDARFEAIRSVLGLGPDDPTDMIYTSLAGYPGTADPVSFRRRLKPFWQRGRELGLDFDIYPLESLELTEDGRLRAGERILTAILRLFTPHGIEESAGLDALRAAVERGTVRMYLPSATWLIANKTTLAWLWDDLELMAADDAEFVRRCVPRTRVLTPAGRQEAIDGRARLVLKPAGSFGGRGVVIGHRLSAAEWLTAVDEAVESGRYLTQELVAADLLPIDLLDAGGTIRRTSVDCCVAIYLFNGVGSGALTRFAPPAEHTGVLNLQQGAMLSGLLLVSGE